MELEQFQPVDRNAWIEWEDANVFIRSSWRYLEGRTVNMLDLGSIYRPSRSTNVLRNYNNTQTTGFLVRFMDAFESHARNRWDGIYVENVINEWLLPNLEKRGYKEIKGDPIPCLYLLFPTI